MVDNAHEEEVRQIIARIDSAWQKHRFDAFEECFDERAVIVGPGNMIYADGARACADSYREFASNARMLMYSESDHELRVWPSTAVYTFCWWMTYERAEQQTTEAGTDQLVFGRTNGAWRVLFRHVQFTSEPAGKGSHRQ